jgi:hypothetical protein
MWSHVSELVYKINETISVADQVSLQIPEPTILDNNQ